MRGRGRQLAIALLIAGLLIALAFSLKKTPVRGLPSGKIVVTPKAGPWWAYPDPIRTPGLPNPQITQSNVEETICNPDWDKTAFRPASSYTTRLKREQMQAWGLPGTTSDYEEDHFISLELGGSNDISNLWPEAANPKPGFHEKDQVENYLHEQVCAGSISLLDAQTEISTNWLTIYNEMPPK